MKKQKTNNKKQLVLTHRFASYKKPTVGRDSLRWEDHLILMMKISE